MSTLLGLDAHADTARAEHGSQRVGFPSDAPSSLLTPVGPASPVFSFILRVTMLESYQPLFRHVSRKRPSNSASVGASNVLLGFG